MMALTRQNMYFFIVCYFLGFPQEF